MKPAPSSSPTVPTRNGPTRWARRPPVAPNTTSGRANRVMPRLAIHSAVSRSSRAIDHSASNEPIITHTAQPSSTAPANGRIRSRSKARRCDAATVGRRRLGRGVAHDERHGEDVGGGDHEERPGDPERADEQGGDGRPGGEPGDVGGEQAAEVVADAVGLGHDHDAADGRHGHARRRCPSRSARRGTARSPGPRPARGGRRC